MRKMLERCVPGGMIKTSGIRISPIEGIKCENHLLATRYGISFIPVRVFFYAEGKETDLPADSGG